MARGRRERDRPKAPPGALYDPNKRVKLSYDSESEEEAAAPAPASAPATATATADAHIQAFARSKAADLNPDEPVASSETGSRLDREDAVPIANEDGVEGKEKGDAEEDAQDEVEYERSRQKTKLRNVQTGQWHALGSMSWQDEGDGEDGDGEGDEEGSIEAAMEYLRSVRTERQTLPTVLRVSNLQPHDGDSEDFHAFDSDHAYIAPPDLPTEYLNTSLDPREAFTEALKERFHCQRNHLHLPPSSEAVTALSDKHPISYPRSNNKATLEWMKIFASVAPFSAQLQSLDEETVYRLLELLQDRCLLRQQEINRITSAWIWSLLARLSEVGMMNNDDVYAVRAFGKKAVLVLVSFRSADTAAQLEDIADVESGASKRGSKQSVSDSDEIDIEATEYSNTATQMKALEADRENTLATLDSILVIIGDIFRQRDLLEFRQPWEVDGDGSLNG